ncbi:MAG: CHASE2 domain-containing protein [Chthoniobacterales bacterium]
MQESKGPVQKLLAFFARRVFVTSIVALVCFVGLIALDVARPFAYSRLRNIYRDAVSRAGRKTAPNDKLVFLAIDSDSVGLETGADLEEMFGVTDKDSVEARALAAMTQHWPWPREVYALVLERLVESGAKAVLFDLTFPTPTAGDAPFREALERYRDHVVVGSNFVSASSRGFVMSGASHTRPPDSLIPQTTPMDDRVGYTNFWPDDDDVVRRAQFRVTFEQVQGEFFSADSERFISLGARALMKAGLSDTVPAGLDDHMFRFTAPPREGFRPHPIFEIFVPDYWQHNYGSGRFFKNKIVVIGAEGNWQHDEHPTPLGTMPGPEVHLNAMNAAIRGEFIHDLPPWSVTLFTALAGVIAVLASLFIRSPWLRLGVLVATDVAAGYVAVFVFDHASVFVPMIAPMGELNLTVLLSLFSDFTWERLEKKRLRRTLERYVSKNVVHELLDNPQAYTAALGGVIKPATILFSDIRGYSSVSARTDPQALVAQLNEYLTAMVNCVFDHGGTLDKFIGDAVMAVWGNTRSDGVVNDAANAVRAALAMRDVLVRLNDSWRARGWAEIRVGFAIHKGDVVVGNIGSPHRMEFTVIGDPVNVTWKLQEATKQIGSQLVVSRAVQCLLREHFDFRELGSVTLPGMDGSYEIYSAEPLSDVAARREPVPA